MPRKSRQSKKQIEKIVDDILAGRRKQGEVSAELGITRQAVNNWVRKRVKPERFKPKPKPPPPPIPRLTAEQEEFVCNAVLQSRPSKHRLLVEEDEWLPVTVRDLIQSKFDLGVPLATVEILVRERELPVKVRSAMIEGQRKRGRPRKGMGLENLSYPHEVSSDPPAEQIVEDTAILPPLKESDLPDEDPELATADLDFYKQAIKRSQDKMGKAGKIKNLYGPVGHGVRTGKHARAGKRRKKGRR